MSAISDERRELAARTKGWLFDSEAEALHRYALQSQGPLVELGSYCGKSTVWIGDAAEQINQPLWAVDWHKGSPEMGVGMSCHDPDVIGPDGHDTLPFLRRTIEAAGLQSHVIPVVGHSEMVGAAWSGATVGFLFVDADHGFQVQRDWAAWATKLRSDAWVCFHDSGIDTIDGAINMALRGGYELVERVEGLTVLC